MEVAMSRFSATVLELFQSPENAGEMAEPDRVGLGSLNGTPPFVTIFLQLDQDRSRVLKACFLANGCGVTIASASMLTILVKGRELRDCAAITVDDLISALDGLPPDRRYCAHVAIEALRSALTNDLTNETP